MIQISMYGANWCPDCQRAKQFLNEHNIDFDYIDVDVNQEATKLVESINAGKRIIPTFIIDGKSYSNPDNAKLSSLLGLNDVGQLFLFGADWCPDCKRAKSYLNDQRINYVYIDVDRHDWATEKVESINNGKRIIPTIIFNDQPYTNPDNKQLSDLLQINEERSAKLYDVIIIGAGAAGLTSSIYAQRDRFDTLILEQKTIGGNAYLTEKIENYPGFTTISGPDLMDRMAEQATTYGAEIKQGVVVESIIKDSDLFTVKANTGEYAGRSIILATGSTYRQLNIPGEQNLIGAGIHFCATCDGAFYRDRDVIVIGGGNSALEEGIFLAGFCKSVTIVNRSESFSASSTYVEKLDSIDNIQTLMNKRSLEFIANDSGTFAALKVQDNDTEEISELTADGVFIFVGLVPNTGFLGDFIELTESKHIKTGCATASTSVDGVFAAGDCRNGAIAQVASATGEGVLASYAIRSYLNE